MNAGELLAYLEGERKRADDRGDMVRGGAFYDALKFLEGHTLAGFDRRAADKLADEVASLVKRGILDARSPAGDALLDYRNPPTSERSDRLALLEAKVAELSTPTVYWLADDPETGNSSLEEMVNDYDIEPGEVREVWRGHDLGKAFIAVHVDPKDEDDRVVTEHATLEEAKLAASEPLPPVADMDPALEHFVRRMEAPPA